MKKIEFTVPLNEEEGRQAPLYIRDLRKAIEKADESTQSLNQVIENAAKLDEKIADLQQGDGSDEKAAAKLNTYRTQREQIESAIERGKSAHFSALENLKSEVAQANAFIRAVCENCLKAKLQDTWNEAVLPFFFKNHEDPKSLDFQFQMSSAKLALKTFFQFHPASDDLDELKEKALGKIAQITRLIDGQVFWAFDGGHEVENAA